MCIIMQRIIEKKDTNYFSLDFEMGLALTTEADEWQVK